MTYVEYIGVHLVDLPHGVRGFTKKNKDGSYSIMINARLSSEMQIHTYDHEIRHIENGDYDNMADVDLVEKHRHIG
ncbi:MAG: hypothetical protein K0R19_2838 [Bacillota bacterium]|jgi:hypothetical protein|nr:hypothetical protein [Bacillota bacterium]